MSNGDDVLDNWEEIDEAELTSKLQKLEKECKSKDESKLEEIKAYSAVISTEEIATTTPTNPTVPGTMKLLQRAAQTKILPSSTVTTSQQSTAVVATEDLTSPLDDMSSTFQPVLMVLHKDTDEYQSANYAQPINTQTVKILRRPTQSSEPRNNGVRPKQPIKTLQQREQEYAEARLRILGSAKNPEDDTANASSTTTPTTSNTITTTSNTSAVASATSIATAATTPSIQSITNANNTQAKSNVSVPRNQPQQQQHYGPVQSAYNNYYQQQQQQQNLYYQKQQLQQQQQLQHSLSSPAFGNNRLHFSTAGLLPTPPIASVVASNMQQRHQFQQLQHYHQHPQQQQQQQQQQTWSPVVGGTVSSYTLQRQQQRQQQQQHQQLQQQQQLDILRTPRGPDGSTGFQMRR